MQEILNQQIEQQREIIRYDTFDFTVEILINKFSEITPIEDEEKDIFIPEYQRNYVWRQKQKSRFIESVVLGLPIPIMFFAKNKDGNMEIIDGSQRMRTLYEFYNNKFHLSDLKKLPFLNKLSYENLPLPQKKNFKNSVLRIAVINGANKETKKDLFDRINTSSTPATPMEVRIGSHSGLFMNFILNAAKDKDFIKLTPIAKMYEKKRAREELVLRLFAYAENLNHYTNNVKNILDNYLQEKNGTLKESDITQYATKFNRLMTFIESTFPQGFKIKNPKAKYVSRIEFEAIAIGSLLALEEKNNLKVNDVSWLKDSEFIQLVTTDGRSNSPERVKGRINFVKNHLLGRNG